MVLYENIELLGVIYFIISVIVFISIIVIAKRLLSIKESQETLVKIQTLQGISSGALHSKTCKSCSEIYATDLVVDKEVCPNCGAENREEE